jgi:uncharacterized protein (TIRG00374 family)
MRDRPRLRAALKLVASLGLLALLIAHIGPREIFRTLASVEPRLLAAPFLLIFADQALRILAWRTLLRARGFHPPLEALAYGYFAGTFLGSLVPSSLGTDLSRAFAISRTAKVPFAQTAPSVLVLSLFGLFGMCLVAGGSSLALLAAGRSLAVTNLVLLFAAAYVVVILLLWQGGMPRAVTGALGRFRLTRPIGARLSSWYDALHVYTRRETLWAITGITLVNQAISVVWNYSVAVALGLNISIVWFVLFIPIVTLGKLVPLTFMGFGVEQGYFAYLFGQVGVPAAEAVAISLLVATCNLVYAILCGVIYVLGNARAALRADGGWSAVGAVSQPE